MLFTASSLAREFVTNDARARVLLYKIELIVDINRPGTWLILVTITPVFSILLSTPLHHPAIHSTTLNPKMEKKCILCDAPAKSCASCKSVAYCSPECQHTDWPVHKTLCKKIGSFAVGNPRPVDGKLALLFPENEKAPRLVWVICEEKSGMYTASRNDSIPAGWLTCWPCRRILGRRRG